MMVIYLEAAFVLACAHWDILIYLRIPPCTKLPIDVYISFGSMNIFQLFVCVILILIFFQTHAVQYGQEVSDTILTPLISSLY